MSLEQLESVSTQCALETLHFPAPFQAVIFRNWGMVPVERLAEVLDCGVEEILEAGEQLGLTQDDSRCQLWLTHGYQTIIRQNWHLLTFQQILLALGWTAEKLEFILREDDFFWIKLGRLKPQVKPPYWRRLKEGERERTQDIREFVTSLMNSIPAERQRPFGFLTDGIEPPRSMVENRGGGLRMLYAYSALYGDPLLDESLDPFPDDQLDAYAASGVNALWMQAVLYTLVPWLGDGPVARSYSAGWEIRLANLRRLAQRMASRGIRLMLYFNEPRGLPSRFFDERPSWRGTHSPHQQDDLYAMCTSEPEVLANLRQGVERLFREVPELGGFFCITRSENLTSCWSLSFGNGKPICTRCAPRNPAQVIAEVIGTMAEGAWAAKPDAQVIAWNWSWAESWDEELVRLLPQGVKLQCVSEKQLPTLVGGIPGTVSDYSISKPGPGPVAQRLWKVARQQGTDVVAKVQLNCTWELSAVPYIPVPGLVEEHLDNLRALGISDFMVSWTLGGYPGGNLRLLLKRKEELAREDFGQAAPQILQAYELFDASFRHFPSNGTATLYLAPQNYGSSSFLYEQPTGYRATMIGFPYDDLKSWRGQYPEEVFENEFRIVSEGWGEGCARLKDATDLVESQHRKAYEELCRVAQASYCHFRSTYLQIVFVRRRDAHDRAGMLAAVREEKDLALRLLVLQREDSRIGYEASNHYYYTTHLLLEKLLNCRRLEQLLAE